MELFINWRMNGRYSGMFEQVQAPARKKPVISEAAIPTAMTEKSLFSREEAAFAIGVSVRTLDDYIARGEINTLRIGRKVMIPAAELRRFAAANHFGTVTGVAV